MAIIHGYIDTKNGNIGYVGDLHLREDVYFDESVEGEGSGNVADLKYVRVGRHTFEYWERLSPAARWNAVQEYPAFVSDTPTGGK